MDKSEVARFYGPRCSVPFFSSERIAQVQVDGRTVCRHCSDIFLLFVCSF